MEAVLEGVPEHVRIWLALCHCLHGALEAFADRGQEECVCVGSANLELMDALEMSLDVAFTLTGVELGVDLGCDGCAVSAGTGVPLDALDLLSCGGQLESLDLLWHAISLHRV